MYCIQRRDNVFQKEENGWVWKEISMIFSGFPNPSLIYAGVGFFSSLLNIGIGRVHC